MTKDSASIATGKVDDHRPACPCLSRGGPAFSAAAWAAIRADLKLSPRELQILYGIFADQKEVTIAVELRISPHTVHTLTRKLHAKLDTTSRLQVVQRVWETFRRLTTAAGTPLPPLCPYHEAGSCSRQRATGP